MSIATGMRAQTLKEFRDALLSIPASSIYHHFWGRLLRPRMDEPEYSNDLASWCYHALHEKPLAERLSMVNPAVFEDLEAMRQEIVEIVEQRLDETELAPWAKADQQFHFLHARLVIFDTGLRVEAPADLAHVLPKLPTGSIYYHVIDAFRRTENGCSDFSVWLSDFGDDYGGLVQQLDAIDPFFSSLKEIRRILADMVLTYFEDGSHG